MADEREQKAGCLGAILTFLFGPTRFPLPYRTRDDFLTPAERSFYHVLAPLVEGRLVVCPKVRLGDLFYVIENDKDRMWRVEALLMLSFRRHTVGEPADRRKAEKLLERFSGDADAFIAAAARAAKAVTADQASNVNHAF